MSSIIDCFHFLWSPRVKARLKEHLVHLKLYEARLVEVKIGIENLKKARDAAQHKVDEEENRYGNGIPKEVEDWIKDVETTIAEYEKFVEDEDHQLAVLDLFKSGYLPKTGIRYRLSRKAFDIARNVNGLVQTAKHDAYSYWLGPPSMGAFFHTVGYQSFPSREETMKKIKEALKTPKVKMIGLHGPSGVGKTTLAKEIARDALEVTKMFDVVAMASITRNPDVRKIQGHIADALGMKLDEESEIARAARIRKGLSNEKKSTLIILDDLWREAALDLNMLGIPLQSGDDNDGDRRTKAMKEIIPSGNVKEGKTNMMTKSKKPPSTSSSGVKTEEALSHYKGCKVLVISEIKQVLSSQMEGKENRIYFVDVLEKKEAESLFKQMAGIGDRNSEFDKLAAQIANKCNGLPMSIVTTARALKNESRSAWEDALRQLERGKLTGVNDFSTRLSYGLLEDEELKYVFLLSARMGSDALIMDLVKYCIGLGFLQRVHTVKEARDRVYALVGKLKVIGLMSDSYLSDHFTMQDSVRSVALSLASKEKHVLFTMTKEKIDEWPDKLERYAAISLHHCHIKGFPRKINYPRLRVFHVNNSSNPHLEIPKNFFKGMKELRVLILTGIRISPLKTSIASLTELRMLSLEQCKLDEDLSIIGQLKKLRILSFSRSDIENLPVELKQLEKLQIFDISNCSKVRQIPFQVISSLISLEELYMRNTFIQWEVGEETHQSKKASLSEFRHLNQLTTLDIQIPYAAHLPKNLFFDKLNNYTIVIGDLSAHSEMDFKMPEKYKASRFLAIQLKDGFDIHSRKGIKMLFERVEHLFLEDLKGVNDIFYRLNLKGFPYLKHLLVVNNSDIKSLIDPEERRHREKAFPKLESFYLHNLENLDKICSCKLSAPSFGKLKVIKINLCGKLKTVFSVSVVSLLNVLETIEVSECDALKEIVEVETQSNVDKIEFPELRSLVLRSLYDQFFGFYPISSTRDLFNGKVVVSKLEKMELSSIQIDKIWSDPPLERSKFETLLHLDVNGCSNLKNLMSISMAKSLVNLQSLFVNECEKMTNIFFQEEGSDAKIKGSIFPSLKNIKLSSMKSLGEIWNYKKYKPPSNSFDKLDTLIIEECHKFVNVFPCNVDGMFQSLCNLRVTNCKSMKTVFELDEKKRIHRTVTNLQDVYLETLPKLEHVWEWSKEPNGIKDPDESLKLNSMQKMWVRECHSLKNIFPASVDRCLPSLEYLEIQDCFGLREIVAVENGTKTNKSNHVPSFEFPKLATIKFSELPKFACFYPGAHKLSCPALNDLSIELCDRLEPFRKETTDAENRPTLFSEEVINNLKSMQIESWHALSSSSYMGKGNHRRDNIEELCLSRLMNPEILYSFLHRNPNLKSLSLSNCSFADIVPLKMPPENENLGVVPKLKSLKLIDMSDLQTIGFERDIILQWMEFLTLKNCPCLVNIMPSSVSLTHLTNLEVVNCDGLEKLMPSSVAKSLVQLNSMKVIKCGSMVKIIGNEEENAEKVDIIFTQLKVIELVSLKNLNCFSKSCALEFPSLEKLVVSACPNMEKFSEVYSTSPLLQKIFVVHENDKKISWWKDDLNTTIKEIFKEKRFFDGMDEMSLSEHASLHKDWNELGDVHLGKSGFYSLKTLKLENCEIQPYAIPSNILPYLKNLKELEVRNCNQVEVIFQLNDTEIVETTSQLKYLTLEELPALEYVWEKNCQANTRFPNLRQVTVDDCERLKALFPAALAKNLKKLEEIEIGFCRNLLKIIGNEEGVAEEKLDFPCLTSLDLYYLVKLTFFSPEKFNVKCPELHKLSVMECPKLELFQFQSARPEGEDEGSSTSINRQPLLSDLKDISTLEELVVDWKHTSRLPRQLMKNLKFSLLKEICMFFDVDACEELSFPIDILKKAPEIENMTIGWCSSLEIFHNEYLKIRLDKILKQLKILTLHNVSKLQCINSVHLWLSKACEMLHELYVIDCLDLTKLFCPPPSDSTSFSCLKELNVDKCHGLEYLFTSSVAKLLIHLEEITVKESQSIKEIVANEQDGPAPQDIEFKRLYCISLDSLSSLKCFYSGNDTLQLPSLTQVDIRQCPEMKFFSRGKINADSFRGIQASFYSIDEWVSNSNDELVSNTDLNASVKRVFLQQMLSEGMDQISFSRQRELQEAWDRGLGLQNNLFYSLRILTLDNCDFKQYAIPSNILPCLKNLKELEVRNCYNVAVIFELNDTETMETTSQLKYLTLKGLPELTLVWNKNCQGILKFQNLQQVSVYDCKNMQILFPEALAKNLKLLEKLEIQSCVELREIVGKGENAATGVAKKFAFPCLTSLDLYKLPELAYFYPETFDVECPKLNSLYALSCPKLELFEGANPEGEGESSSTSVNRQPLFSDLTAISLEQLSLDWTHISVLRLRQHTKDLKYLTLWYDADENEKPTFPLDILEKAPNLQDMTIGSIDNLDIFLTSNRKASEHGILGKLKVLTLDNVSELQYIGLEDSWLKIVCQELHELYVLSCPVLTKLFHPPPPDSVSFSCLKELYVDKCRGLEYLFTSSVAKVLMHLEVITVKESQTIKEIVAKEQDGPASEGIKFEQLYCIYLDSLSSLECFYSGNDTLQLPSLYQVDILQCPKMEVFSRGKINADLFKGIQASSDTNELVSNGDLNASVKRMFLQQMLSEGLNTKKISKERELQEAWDDGLGLQNSLKTLTLDNRDMKQYAIPVNGRACLKNLKELEVRNCNKVKVIFEMKDTEIMETEFQLKYLTLEGLRELTLVWDKNSQGILRFQNLQKVSVSGCKNMQALFPEALAKNLKMLKELEIQSCVKLREVVGKGENAATNSTTKFVFPRLISLDLYNLPELTYFYPEKFTVECPTLNHLSVLDCPKFELFQSAHPVGEAESSSTSINRQPLISDLKDISIMEELSLDWKHISVLRQHTEVLKYLNKIILWYDADENEKATFPLDILEKAPNLQDMTIGSINNLEIFLTSNQKASEQLKILTLDKVSELRHICLEDSWLKTVCEKLHELYVLSCPRLTKLFQFSSSVSLSYLKELFVYKCHGLEYLFTSSVAKLLTHIEEITVKESETIKEIVAKEQDETTSQGIKFGWLYCIHLDSLPSLECFYSGNDTLQLPFLTQVDIWQCPKMEIFSRGEISAKSFSGIQPSFDSNDDLVFYNDDVNASVEKAFLQQQDLVFKDSPMLKAIWLKSEKVQNWNWCFCNLNSLIVEGCEFLSDAVLPSHLLPFLSNLKTLEVRKCNSVKAIFVYTNIGPQGSLSLPVLEKLSVENCEKLLEIVAKDETKKKRKKRKTKKKATEEIIMFPRLTFLRLWNLYNLRCIYPEIRMLEWPMLKELYVMHCPVLKFFATEFQSSGDSHPDYQDSFPISQQAFVSLEKVTPRLKVLTLGKEEAKMIDQGKLHVDIQQLNSLVLQCFLDESDVFPFVFRSKVVPFKKLAVLHSAFKEIFHTDCTKILSQLKELELQNLSQLKSIGLEHSWISPFIKNLKTLLVWDCDGLTNLTPSTVSFSNLIKLNVNNCHGLQYLFTSSTAETLSVLRKLCVANCELLKEIVAKEEGDVDEVNKDGILLFKQLEILNLGMLPKLVSFYKGSSTLKFPSLERVSFTQCYNTKVFRLGDQVPNDLKVTIDGKCPPGGDINSVIMQQFEEEIEASC